MASIPRIGIDAMGGDFGPSAVAAGIALALREMPGRFAVTLVGDEGEIRPAFKQRQRRRRCRSRSSTPPSTIEMAEKAAPAARRKSRVVARRPRPSSTRTASVDAIFSAGNTGAVVRDRAARPRPPRVGVAPGARRVHAQHRAAARWCSTSAPTPSARPSTWSSSRTWDRSTRATCSGARTRGSACCRSARRDTKGNAAGARGAAAAAARAAPQLHRQRRGPRRVQGHLRRGRHRRLHRQRACSRPPRAWRLMLAHKMREELAARSARAIGRAAACGRRCGALKDADRLGGVRRGAAARRQRRVLHRTRQQQRARVPQRDPHRSRAFVEKRVNEHIREEIQADHDHRGLTRIRGRHHRRHRDVRARARAHQRRPRAASSTPRTSGSSSAPGSASAGSRRPRTGVLRSRA